MVVNQGDIFWVQLDEPAGSGPGYPRPHVVIQNDIFNHSRLNTVVVCGLTTNLQRATAPGNVLLEPGEGELLKQSVVNVTQLFTVDKSVLEERIGTLSPRRVAQILEGISLVLTPVGGIEAW